MLYHFMPHEIRAVDSFKIKYDIGDITGKGIKVKWLRF